MRSAAAKLAFAAALILVGGCQPKETWVDPFKDWNDRVARYTRQPDAAIYLAPYEPERDQIAAAECWGAYAWVGFHLAYDVRLGIDEHRHYVIRTFRGEQALRELVDQFGPRFELGPQSEGRAHGTAWAMRHPFRPGKNLGFFDTDEFRDASDEDRNTYLAAIEAHLAQCDKAVVAWGLAVPSDEEIISNISPLMPMTAAQRADGLAAWSAKQKAPGTRQ